MTLYWRFLDWISSRSEKTPSCPTHIVRTQRQFLKNREGVRLDEVPTDNPSPPDLENNESQETIEDVWNRAREESSSLLNNAFFFTYSEVAFTVTPTLVMQVGLLYLLYEDLIPQFELRVNFLFIFSNLYYLFLLASDSFYFKIVDWYRKHQRESFSKTVLFLSLLDILLDFACVGLTVLNSLNYQVIDSILNMTAFIFVGELDEMAGRVFMNHLERRNIQRFRNPIVMLDAQLVEQKMKKLDQDDSAAPSTNTSEQLAEEDGVVRRVQNSVNWLISFLLPGDPHYERV